MNRLEGELDAVLHLLDRQVVDVDGLLVCNVDDVELTEVGDGTLAVTGLLVGPAALIPRFSGRLGRSLLETWRHLGVERADRTTPRWIGLADVARVTSEVRLSVAREGLLVLQPPAAEGARHHRLGDLVDFRVERSGQEGRRGRSERILDVRVLKRPGPGVGRSLVCTHLVVGRGGPGSLLGYDRNDTMGPAVVRKAVRWWHRGTGQVSFDDVDAIHWDDRVVSLAHDPERLAPADAGERSPYS